MGNLTEATEEEKEAFPKDMAVITIVLDGNKPPRVDLGTIAPYMAITIFDSIAETLGELLLPPVIKYDGKTIIDFGHSDKYDNFVFGNDEDDDDLFDWDDEDD